MAKVHKQIPETAQKVFSGVIFDVYQWEQQMYDGTTATFERVKRPYTVQVIAVTDEGKILFIREQQPDMNAPIVGLPGGRMDVPGETSEAAAQRELLEETGYSAPEWTLWLEERPVSKLDWYVYTFIARGCVKTSDIHLDRGERVETVLLTYEDFIKTVLDESFTFDDIAKVVMRMLLQKKDEELKKIIFG